MKRDRRHGWQITQVVQLDKPEPVSEVEIGLAPTSELELVEELITFLTGPDAPSQAQLLQSMDQLTPFFADTPMGRKSMAQIMGIQSILMVYGMDAGSHELSQDGNEITVTWESSRSTAPSLRVYTTVGPKIETLEFD